MRSVSSPLQLLRSAKLALHSITRHLNFKRLNYKPALHKHVNKQPGSACSTRLKRSRVRLARIVHTLPYTNVGIFVSIFMQRLPFACKPPWHVIPCPSNQTFLTVYKQMTCVLPKLDPPQTQSRSVYPDHSSTIMHSSGNICLYIYAEVALCL